MSDISKVPELGSGKTPEKRPCSPQPSTSKATFPPLPDPEEPAGAAATAGPVRPGNEDSVYSHVNVDLSNIGQMKGLKSGRRHGRWRKLQQARLAYKYAEAVKALQPLIKEEIVKQQTQYVLITAALDNFANTVNGIVDKAEGKKDPTNYTERLEAFKKKAAELREKRRLKNPNAEEFKYGPPPPKPKLSEEETNRRLRIETEAAIEALTLASKQKEIPPEVRYAHILEAFNKMIK